MIRQNTKREFEKKLMRRGMVKMTDGTILKAPIRNYRTLGEEILWMMNEADISLCVDDLSRYLVTDKKTIQKVMRKLTASNVNLVKNIGIGKKATHTKFKDVEAGVESSSLKFPLVHPPFVIRDSKADKITDRNRFLKPRVIAGMMYKKLK